MQNVPDMPDPGDGSLTFYYTNQQSARLMFYHDHAYGITRLNVYAGEAAGYLITDPTEKDLDRRPAFSRVVGTPLIIQDKTFVPDAPNCCRQRSHLAVPGRRSAAVLWFPHVYMPNQNPNAQTA